jgi:hypothetical protein
VAESDAGHFLTGIDPEMCTLLPAATVDGETLIEAFAP